MGTCPDAVKRLIEQFNQQADQLRSPAYGEAQLRVDYVNPLFRELGWDVDNAKRFGDQYHDGPRTDTNQRA